MKLQEGLKAIVERMIEVMENDGSKWVKSWVSHSLTPQNFVTKRPYRGFNTLYLSFVMQERGYKTPYFLTLKQANELGGKIKKGAKSIEIYFYKMIEIESDELDENNNPIKRRVPMLRMYRVFNIEDTEGIDYSLPEPVGTDERNEQIETFIDNVSPVISHGEPAYTPALDLITMPNIVDFKNPDAYYSTLFHELTHWSGASHRLNREIKNRFGTKDYAFEELVAELGSVFLSSHFGVEIEEARHGAYLKSWLKAIKDDYRYLWRAASKAQEAFDYLLKLGNQAEEDEENAA
ncbi:ArdC family protein [Nitrosophilus labii]|uniref:ArdC family protein n=1 Tax=Nitrosophilus labii TaxID=2706014 RepID=UPI0016570E36|nr:zincin-like metallopeptidase domain-containing protein [Nitrosophilus labii]